MLTDKDKQKIIKLYDEGYSTSYIAEELRTYPNKINRFLRKSGKPIRSKSEAQKMSLEKGISTHPTEGKTRTDEEKSKIRQSLMDYWVALSDEEYEKKVEKSRELWYKKSEEEREEMRALAAKGMARASREGSKIEKFLKSKLGSLGYNVIFHKTGLIENHDLEVDIFLPNQNLIIEIDGPTHFIPIFGDEKLEKVIESDREKNGLLISKGYTVLRVRYASKRFGEILKEKLVKSIIDFINSDKCTPGQIVEIEL